jgi:cytochrome c oxidase subunit II
MSQQSATQGSPGAPAHLRTRTVDAAGRVFFVILGILAAVAGIAMGIWNPFLSNAASVQGTDIDILFGVALGISTAIFVIVQGTLVYSIIRFSREPGDESDGPPIHGNTALEVVWTAIPAAIVVFLAIYSYQILNRIDSVQPDALNVEVRAMQYAWQFYYPDSGVTSNELHIPLNRQVRLQMRSNDVIHSFWVPKFRIKKDVLPDRVTETLLTATELGTYPIVCAELCGASHALMRANLVVQPAADFQNWLAIETGARERPTEAAPAASDIVAQGKQIFVQSGCGGCHAMGDANAAGQVGPSLDDIGTRAATAVPGQSAEEYIRIAIVQPAEHVVSGYQPIMPGTYATTLSEAELNALTQYLLAQQ